MIRSPLSSFSGSEGRLKFLYRLQPEPDRFAQGFSELVPVPFSAKKFIPIHLDPSHMDQTRLAFFVDPEAISPKQAVQISRIFRSFFF